MICDEELYTYLHFFFLQDYKIPLSSSTIYNTMQKYHVNIKCIKYKYFYDKLNLNNILCLFYHYEFKNNY